MFVVKIDMSCASLMRFKVVLIEDNLDLRSALVDTAPCAYLVLTDLADDGLSSSSCLSDYKDLLVAHL